MQRIPSLLLLFAALVGQGPRPEPPKVHEEKPVLSKAATLANKRTIARMQGAWRLVEMRIVDADSFGMSDLSLDHVGFCLVSGNYLSIELHLRLLGQKGQDSGRSFITGLHKFDLDESGEMETSTVIGTYVDSYRDIKFEPPDTQRHYSIDLEGDTMTLTRDDGHRLSFERLLADKTRFDFFGRPVTEEEAAEDESGEKTDKKDDGDDDDGGR